MNVGPGGSVISASMRNDELSECTDASWDWSRLPLNVQCKIWRQTLLKSSVAHCDSEAVFCLATPHMNGSFFSLSLSLSLYWELAKCSFWKSDKATHDLATCQILKERSGDVKILPFKLFASLKLMETSFKIMERNVEIQDVGEIFVLIPLSVLVFWKQVAQDDSILDCEALVRNFLAAVVPS